MIKWLKFFRMHLHKTKQSLTITMGKSSVPREEGGLIDARRYFLFLSFSIVVVLSLHSCIVSSKGIVSKFNYSIISPRGKLSLLLQESAHGARRFRFARREPFGSSAIRANDDSQSKRTLGRIVTWMPD